MPGIGIGIGIGLARAGGGLPSYIQSALAFLLWQPIENGYYPNKIGDQDRVAVGGEIFPGRAHAFNGVDQAVLYPSSVWNNGADDISISIWVKADSIGTQQYILGHNGSNAAMFLRIQDDGRVRLYASDTNGEAQVNCYTDALTESDKWYHVVFVVNRTTGTPVAYVDGVEATWTYSAYTPTGVSFALDDDDYFKLGRYADAVYNPGVYRDFRVWNTQLSASEVVQVKEGESVQMDYCRLWDFGESTDLLESFDASGEENHGECVGFDSSSFVEGNWQSLMNKFGYAIDVKGPNDLLPGTGVNYKINEVDSWTPYGTNDLQQDGDAIHLTGDGSSIIGAFVYFRDANSVRYNNLRIGGKVRIQWKTKTTFGTDTNIDVHNGTSLEPTIETVVNQLEYEEYEHEFEAGNLALNGYFQTNSISDEEEVWTEIMGMWNYYDTAIPPDMSTGDVPTHDIFGNTLINKGQAKYSAVPRNCPCYQGDGTGYWSFGQDVNLGDVNTVSAKVKFTGPTTNGGVLGKTDEWHYALRLYNGNIYYSCGDALSWPFTNDEEEHAFIVTKNGRDVELFIDGVSQGVQTLDGDYDLIVDNIGRLPTLYFEGEMYDVRTFDQVLTAEQIASVGAGDVLGIETNHFPFVEGEGEASHNVAPDATIHLTGMNIGGANWGSIDYPDRDYLAEHGANFARSFNGVDDYHSAAVSDYLGDATSGSVKVFMRCIAGRSNQVAFCSANPDASTLYFCCMLDTANRPNLFVRNGATFYNQLRANEVLSDGWHLIEFISDGSNYTIKTDGVENTLTVIAGLDDGKWIGEITGRGDVSIGAFTDITPFYGAQEVMWVKVDDGENGDWYYNPVTDQFVDRSSLGLTMDASGTDTDILTIPARSDKSADAQGQPLTYPQSGKNLIPRTYFSFPANIAELVEADDDDEFYDAVTEDPEIMAWSDMLEDGLNEGIWYLNALQDRDFVLLQKNHGLDAAAITKLKNFLKIV